ncbi:MAG: hypothetical protein A2527_02195 [Candidatus Lambdaproteobacteria bacterium RIFOXYD2_FULL_50_16]|uniref:Uncharacterized protein n=1 Tax=Candidatus Lambdaproteobacteria bacterium RIFOXYD2_FULL_50_16 TaxID=1817772 RepID=A0A1F6GDV6_9PROT|nr:MAG: hypothetical protein A2527_02195 [Candidatus Lambdaproteobacteria bacterium RIFOXYD2_FULL_50_16]
MGPKPWFTTSTSQRVLKNYSIPKQKKNLEQKETLTLAYMNDDNRTLAQAEPKVIRVDNTEDYILEVFYQDQVQERIKSQLQKVIKEELLKMSDLLREAVRDWVEKEKAKSNPEEERQKQILLSEKLENFEVNNKKLEEENRALKRRMELKEHENQMMMRGIKKFMDMSRKQ